MKKFVFLLICIAVLFVANIFFGSVNICFHDVWTSLLGHSNDANINFIVRQSRLPQVVTSLLTGASLALAGLLLQTAFHNPLAGPSVLGISGGASLGVAIVTLCGFGSVFSIVGASFVGAVLVTILLLFLSSLLRNNLVLLITGLLLGYLISAVITILNVAATPEGLRTYVLWGMGDFSSVNLLQLPYYTIMLAIFMLLAFLILKPLNALQLGDQYAANLGVNVTRLRNILLLIVGGITAVTTAFCGPIAFIGLAVPHIARMFCRSDNFRHLLPTTLLAGATVALLCTLLCATLTSNILPLNAITPIVGIPVITYVIIRRQF